jgi:hypothetical protein
MRGAAFTAGLLLLGFVPLASASCSKGEDRSGPAPAASQPSSTGHLVLVEGPPSGDIPTVVRDALAKAAADGRRLIVYEGATWCEPCQRFHKAAEAGELDSAFPDLTMLTFDIDRDGKRLANAGYTSKYIPLFMLPNVDGTASGVKVEGGVKGDGAVADITPRLRDLLMK